MKCKNKYPAFTLVEILIVVALVGILTTITIVALNPAKNFQTTRNTQRISHVNAILNGITQYFTEQGADIDDFQVVNAAGNGLEDIITCVSGADDILLLGEIPNHPDEVDLHTILVDEYIIDIPEDPQNSPANKTAGVSGYTVCKQGSTRIQIAAPNAEGGASIIVKR